MQLGWLLCSLDGVGHVGVVPPADPGGITTKGKTRDNTADSLGMSCMHDGNSCAKGQQEAE